MKQGEIRLHVRVTEEEKILFKEAAEACEISLSDWVRSRLQSTATNDLSWLERRRRGKMIQGLRRAVGDEQPRTPGSRNNLVLLYKLQGRYDEAEPLLRETLRERRRVLGDRHRDTLTSYYNLGCLAAARGQRQRALELLRQAVSLGWSGKEISSHRDFDDLRGTPEFEAIVAQVTERLGRPAGAAAHKPPYRSQSRFLKT